MFPCGSTLFINFPSKNDQNITEIDMSFPRKDVFISPYMRTFPIKDVFISPYMGTFPKGRGNG